MAGTTADGPSSPTETINVMLTLMAATAVLAGHRATEAGRALPGSSASCRRTCLTSWASLGRLAVPPPLPGRRGCLLLVWHLGVRVRLGLRGHRGQQVVRGFHAGPPDRAGADLGRGGAAGAWGSGIGG